MDYIAYTRVSTKDQQQHGYSLGEQLKIIRRFIGDDTLIYTYTESESGKNRRRPELQKALKRCKDTGATLIIAKLDRLARDLSFLMSVIDTPGVEVKFCDMPQSNRLMIQIIGAIAEYEAKLISERTKIGVRAAMAAGKMQNNGRTFTPEEIGRSADVRRTLARQQNKQAYALAKNLRKGGATLQEICVSLNENGFASSRGNPFSVKTVRDLLKLYVDG
jgi:DNA invertase Pin-like site-specific DNA recombinase